MDDTVFSVRYKLRPEKQLAIKTGGIYDKIEGNLRQKKTFLHPPIFYERITRHVTSHSLREVQ